MAELDDPVGRHRAVAARAAELGIELIAVGTDATASPPVSDDDAVRRHRADRHGAPPCSSRPAGPSGSSGWPPSLADERERALSCRRRPAPGTWQEAVGRQPPQVAPPRQPRAATTAPMPSTQRAPMASMIGPKIRLPSGIDPPKAMNHSGITLARSVSARFSWKIVISAVAARK